MSRMAAILREEINRLARKETKQATSPLKRRLAALEKIVREQRVALKQLARQVAVAARGVARTTPAATATVARDGARLSPRLIRSLRTRLKLSQMDFARLTGVTHVAVYLWESGKTKPRGSSREAIIGLRGVGVREVRKRLANLDAAAPVSKERRRTSASKSSKATQRRVSRR